MAGTAVIYHYHEKDPAYRDNFVFFLSRAWRADLDLHVVIAGAHSLDLPRRPNVTYHCTPNLGHDFAGYCSLIETGALDRYERLVFVNCTVRGPFLPPYAAGLPWTEPFLRLLAGEVHLCGATINILHDSRPAHARFRDRHPQAAAPFSHVQSSAHAMTGACFAFLRAAGFYAQGRAPDKDTAIADFEIAMSARVRANGWNIACLLPPYNALDYRQPHQDINPATTTGYPQAQGAYFGLSPHPYELVFVKTGWGVLSPQALAFHSLMALRHHPAPGLDWAEGRALAARLARELGPPLATLPRSGAPAPARARVQPAAAEPASPGPAARRCLLVLGMHRSGTSALAGLLVQQGLAAPATPMAPHASNPRGFFESVPVRDFNDALLAKISSSWKDWRPLPSGWHRRPEVQALQREAARLIAAEFGTAPVLVLKDPRICRLLPFWRAALAAAGVAVAVVHTHRHPGEVAASLADRYQFAPAFSQLLWLRHLLEAEAASRDLPRCFTSYDRLLADPVAEVAKIGRCLGLALEGGADARDFVAPELRRHRLDAERAPAQELPAWHRDTLAVFERYCADAEGEPDGGELDGAELDGGRDARAGDPGTLDRIRGELDRAAAAIAPILDNDRIAETRLRRARRELRRCRKAEAVLQAELARARGDAMTAPTLTPGPPEPLHSTRLFPKFRGADAYRLTGIAACCDWVVLSDTHPPEVALLRRDDRAAPRHVFLSLRAPVPALRFFCTEVLPQIAGRFVLVSGSEDVTVPRQTDRRWPPFDAEQRAMIAALLEDPRLICWFAENLDTAHPRMHPLPLGMVWPDGPPDPPAPVPVPPPLGPRPLHVLCAHRIRDGAQWEPRRQVSALAAGPWAEFTTRPEADLPEPDFLAAVEACSFVLCVEGGGLDPAPKAWVALLHGAIPILRDTPVAAAYRALPVAVVPDWTTEALTPERLAAWKAARVPRFDDPQQRAEVVAQLGLAFWWDRIEAACRAG